MLKWALGGLAAGVVGAGIWAGIAYATQHEIGWIAWGVGLLVGLGVRLTAGEEDGPAPGVTAAIIAILAIVAGKYLAIHLLIAKETSNLGNSKASAQDMIASEASDICMERMSKNQRINWPRGVTLETATEQKDFPPDVWNEATARWQQLGPDEQKKRIQEHEKEYKAVVDTLTGQIRKVAFKESFGLFDILWFVLATVTAFKVGSGLASEK
jgi:hypothetical protein